MSAYRITVVVNREFGDNLTKIAKHVHVWLCNTPMNLQAAHSVNEHLKQEGKWNEQGITTFRISSSETPEEMIISQMATIDLHYNEYSHYPAWSEIEIYGVSPTPRLREELQGYGVTEFRKTPEGFVCSRAESVTA